MTKSRSVCNKDRFSGFNFYFEYRKVSGFVPSLRQPQFVPKPNPGRFWIIANGGVNRMTVSPEEYLNYRLHSQGKI